MAKSDILSNLFRTANALLKAKNPFMQLIICQFVEIVLALEKNLKNEKIILESSDFKRNNIILVIYQLPDHIDAVLVKL